MSRATRAHLQTVGKETLAAGGLLLYFRAMPKDKK
jgi:hypothetical protein